MRIITALCLLFALGLSACATGATSNCAVWDDDNDDVVNEDELTTGLHDDWDANDDGLLDEDEWTTGIDAFGYQPFEAWEFSDWDEDGDNMINRAEFSMSFSEAGVWNDWDRDDDNMLEPDECGFTV